ncbi:Retrovirus-related Pol polyprotein from transposon 17.6, partial [Mucuna pruriens]
MLFGDTYVEFNIFEALKHLAEDHSTFSYMHIHIAPVGQHKTTFTCPFGMFAYRRMSFGLYNAPSTFQRCMISIFSDLLEDCMEVFMGDFTVYAESFEACLNNLSRVLRRCIDSNLVLNFEKCHFMVTEGIVLGHLVSARGIEVDKAKIDVISSLPNPASVWEAVHPRFQQDRPASVQVANRRTPTSSLINLVWRHFKS